jgi:hypothetical protein
VSAGIGLTALALVSGTFFEGLPHGERLNEAAFMMSGLVAWFAYSRAIRTLLSGMNGAAAESVSEYGGYILYLRSFDDDEFQFDSVPYAWGRIVQNIINPFSSYLGLVFPPPCFEDIIVGTVWPYQPVLCVTAPSDAFHISIQHVPLTRMIAPRISLSPETWQDEVLQLAYRADKVVIVIGGTTGVRWEFQSLVSSAALRRKIVLLVPPEDKEAVRARWSVFLGENIESCPAGWTEDATRAIGVRLGANPTLDILFTADERSIRAYELALRLAQTSV